MAKTSSKSSQRTKKRSSTKTKKKAVPARSAKGPFAKFTEQHVAATAKLFLAWSDAMAKLPDDYPFEALPYLYIPYDPDRRPFWPNGPYEEGRYPTDIAGGPVGPWFRQQCMDALKESLEAIRNIEDEKKRQAALTAAIKRYSDCMKRPPPKSPA